MLAASAGGVPGGVRARRPPDACRGRPSGAACRAGARERSPHGQLAWVGRRRLPFLPVVIQVAVALLVRIRYHNALQEQGRGSLGAEWGAVAVDTIPIGNLMGQPTGQALVVPM